MDVSKDFDVTKALAGDEQDLWDVHRATADVALWERVTEKARVTGNATHLATAEKALAELPEVTALQGLEAAHRLAELLIGRRWIDMQRAREQGASWQQIGDVLGMSRQAAQQWYATKIVLQEKYAGEHHDTERARAVLGESGPRITDPASRALLQDDFDERDREYREANYPTTEG